MKTPIFSLIFSLLITLPGIAGATTEADCVSDTLKTAGSGDTLTDDDADLTVDEKILFQEKVYIHIYNQQDKPLISGEFSRKDLKENKVLAQLLRKGTRFLNIDQHYYYYVNEG